ncbi:WXG100 family type VII secretion target [Nocardia sp. AG03]|uniref:WXG100 family type VII secretion target n=1 Tax=Nocardia sp. AG03 TaxID=3025312 RepID=UPI0024181A90|nr:WXG100 family type VII secretion target [Nocardia sp. AG03]
MAAEFKVDLDHLDQIVIKLAGLAGFVADHLDVIDDKVAELVGTGWESVASEAYRVAHAQWVVGAREFADGIREMSTAAKTAHGHYAAASDVNTRMLSGGY